MGTHPSCAALARFYAKVVPGPDGCLDWAASMRVGGYGQFWHDGGMRIAHRWVFQQAHGLLPREVMVCHTCDRRRCVNLQHLYRGDQASNMRDRNERGRQARLRGQSNGMAKLADADLPAIVAAYAEGATLKALAAEYGVAFQTIWRVVKGRRLVALT